jgi:GDP-L-fucose synthase
MNSLPKDTRIFVAGHRGMVGSAILRRLETEGYGNLITRELEDLDLRDRDAVRRLFEETRPECVYLCAAKVGGILANNTYPAEFIQQNLEIQTNVIHEAWRAGARKLLFLGSSCIYPRDCPQPIREEYLLTGPLEPTNRPYAIAKIAGIEMCWAYNRQYGTRYLAIMPTNLYGPGDNFDLQTSHVLPALVRRFHEGKEAGAVTVWGTGAPRREFLHSADLAAAALFLTSLPEERYSSLCASETAPPLLNVGCGEDLTIRELAELVRDVVGYRGDIAWDASKPDGAPRKLLDISRVRSLGWRPEISLQQGLLSFYAHFLETRDSILNSRFSPRPGS